MARDPKRPLWAHPPITAQAARAIKAMAAGTLDAEGQKWLLKYLTEEICLTYHEMFTPDNPRVTDYLLGRRSVGRWIVNHLNLSVAELNKLTGQTGE